MSATTGDPRRVFGSVLFAPALIGVVAAAVLASSMMRARGEDTNAMRYYVADRNASIAAERWVVSATVDSLKTWVTSLHAPADSLVVRVGADVPARAGAVADSMLRSEWRAIAPHREDVRIAAIVVLDTARDAVNLKRTHERLPLYAMPWTLDNRTCVAVIRVSRTVASEPALMTGNTRLYDPPTLGSCAYVAALGLPGADARKWMDDFGNVRAARANWWQQRENRAVPRSTDESGSAIRSNNYQERIFESRRSLALSGCRHGDQTFCAQLLQPVASGEIVNNDLRFAYGTVVPPRGVMMPYTREAGSALGLMLSDLIKQLGVAHVGAAWRANEPFVNALAASAKKTPSELGANWLRTSVPVSDDGSGEVGFAAIVATVFAGLMLMGIALITARGRERA